MSEQVVTPVGRLLWANLETPDENGKYTVKLAFEQSPKLEELRDLAVQTSIERFGKQLPLPFKDGNESTNEDGEVWPWTKDQVIVTFRTKIKPTLVSPAGGSATIEASEFYHGCYVRLVTDFYGWTYQAKKGISASIHAIQFYGHGEKIGGGKRLALDTAFGAVENNGVTPLEA